jgi:SAM-dependent methyltransferase
MKRVVRCSPKKLCFRSWLRKLTLVVSRLPRSSNSIRPTSGSTIQRSSRVVPSSRRSRSASLSAAIAFQLPRPLAAARGAYLATEVENSQVNFLKLIEHKPVIAKIGFVMSVLRRKIVLAAGSHALDTPIFYCQGQGLEIGASDCPYTFPSFKVDYADFFDESRKHYLGKDGFFALKAPKCALDGVGTEKYDFVYASHVLEHTLNPLMTVEEWLRVLRPGGILYIAIPNKEKMYDKSRSTTPVEVLKYRYDFNMWSVDPAHVRSMVGDTDGLPDYPGKTDPGFDAFCEHVLAQPNGSHHYFTFDPKSSLDFASVCEELFSMELLSYQLIRHEIHMVMRKAG